MLNIIQNIFRIEELRQRIFFTLAMLFIFRLGAHIPTPGIDGAALTAFFDAQQGSILRFFDMFTGGALARLTVFALGVMPYISASIIIQLLTAVFPYLERLSKEGDAGRKRLQVIPDTEQLFSVWYKVLPLRLDWKVWRHQMDNPL